MSKNRDERPVHRGERDDGDSHKSLDALRSDGRDEALPESREDIESLLRTEALANALPTPPKLDGWHQAWLSTTNTYTPIQQFQRLGYVPVKPEEHPEWQYLKQHGAQHGGDVITCNEMILYKVPEDAYQQIMRVLHHDRPNEEEERLRANVEQMKDSPDFVDRDGKALIQEEGDGFRKERRVRAPSSFQ